MPAVLTLRLGGPVRRPAPRQLQGAAALLFEDPAADHHSAVKPFAVGPLSWAEDMGTWRLGWLGAGDPPPAWPPPAVRFGPSEHPVFGYGGEVWPFAALAAARPARRASMRMLTPTFFSRNGRDLPLPEPVLIVRSLLARWNSHAPADLAIGEDLARDLMATVFLASMRGATEQVMLADQLRQVGYVGDVELRLLKTADSTAAGVFAALMRFAAIAGVGAQTTHGFGAVEVTVGDVRTG